MRQIGSFSERADAERFAAYLVTEGITAHAEADGDGWVIWVRDENRLDEARSALQDFQEHPEESRYQNVVQAAADLRREEETKREAARQNVVEMRGKWGKGGASSKKAPFVFALMGLCVMASLWTKSMNRTARRPTTKQEQLLLFASAASYSQTDSSDPLRAFVDIRQGQVWRLITPILMHGGLWHLVMNLYWVYYLGSQIEHFEGTWKIGLLVILAAVLSNVAQAVSQGPNFLGVSGVATAFFGYVWIRSKYDPSSRLFISNFTIVIFVAYLFYCLFQQNVANEAHFAGLGVGAVMAYLPLLLEKRR